MKMVVVVISLFCFLGCSSKPFFNRGELSAQAGVTAPVFDGDNAIKDAFAKKKNLPKPFKLAVYFRNPPSGQDWRWTDENKAVIEEIGQNLIKQGMVSEIFPLLSTLVANDDLPGLRLAAAKYQVDALLVIGGSGRIERYMNKKAWSYALILPTLFVKGSEVETLFMTSAALWDVRNGYLYLGAETEGLVHNTYAAATGDTDRELYDGAKKSSMEKMKEALTKAIAGSKN